MICPAISLTAFDSRDPFFVFVKVPNERGRYVRTDVSVILVPCRHCGACVGEPCLRGGHALPGRLKTYGAGTHAVRREDADRRKGAPHRPVKSRYRACECGGIDLLSEGTA